jgi:hypothetical protein
METKENLSDPVKAMVLTVLEELAQEQANTSKVLNDLIATLNFQGGTLRELKEKVDKPKPIIAVPDIQPIREIITKAVTDIKLIIGSKPQPIIKKFQLLLFPEQDAKLFYKIVFGRWFLYLVLMLLITCLYKFSVHWSDIREQIQQKELETDQTKKAWYYLYERENKAGKRVMDSAFIKSRQVGD